MRYSIFVFVSLTIFAISGKSQTPPDSVPVLRGKLTYTMQQPEIDAGLRGNVLVAVRVDETGKPIQAIMVAGPIWPCGSTPTKTLENLSSTVSAWMLRMRFSPAIKDGQPIAMDIAIRITLEKPSQAVPDPPNTKLVPGKVESATKDTPKLVNGGVVNGKALSLPKPYYPKEAKENRDSGVIPIQVLIDEKGNVVSAGAVSGPPSLQIAARSAACEAKFLPTTLGGTPVKVTGVISYNFVPPSK